MGKVHASLFSGFGAADLAATWMGWDNAFWCEIDDFPRTVLSYWFPKSKGYGNIKETDFTPWRGKVDVLTGGFPCQPFSCAGQRKGADDDRYLWPEMLRAIREIRPTWIIGENVGGILSMVQPGSEITVESQTSLFEEADKETLLEQEYVVGTVCRDLEQEGYSVQPIVIPACAIGAPHRRDRIFFIARRDTQFAAHPKSNGSSGTSNEASGKIERQDRNEVEQSFFRGGIRLAPDTHGKELQTRIQTRRWTDKAKTRTRLDYGTERFGGLRYAPYANIQLFQECNIPYFREKTRFHSGLPYETRSDWRNFPTQSPVCRGNDGLPFDVVRLTVSITAWCTGSIKGYGNAIVPQVMHEIFKAIEESEK